MIRANNYEEISKRDAFMGNSEFYIMKCNGCGLFALYDEEVSFIYLNPKNLAQKALYGLNISEEVPCPACGKKDSFDEAPDEDYGKVLQSPWMFAIKESKMQNGREIDGEDRCLDEKILHVISKYFSSKLPFYRIMATLLAVIVVVIVTVSLNWLVWRIFFPYIKFWDILFFMIFTMVFLAWHSLCRNIRERYLMVRIIEQIILFLFFFLVIYHLSGGF